MGVGPGDRVAAFMPNVPQTAVAFLACASLGAIWSVCSADMGPLAVLDRFRQIEPTVLVACDGYRYGGVAHDRTALLRDVVAELPSVRDVVFWRGLDASADAGPLGSAARRVHDFAALVAGERTIAPRPLPFAHPLWIVYSSGTTGLPKAIVHGHGGVMLEALKFGTLHNDCGPSVVSGDRYHWYSTTGWIMWNSQMSALLGGATICVYDGSPAGPRSSLPGDQREVDWTTLWRFVAATGATFFGAGAAFYASCEKAGIEPKSAGDLSRLRALGSTGSPLAIESYRWLREHVPAVDGNAIWLTSVSGGTDFAGGFIAGLRTLPVIDGEMQCRCLGAAVEAWSEPDADGHGRALVDEVGELVCTKPMPSMPLYFWGDDPPGRAAGACTTATSTCTPASGATATGCASRRTAARSSTAAATRPSTATASAWERPSCTARSKPCRRCSTASSSTSSTSAARATCRSSSSCAKASRSTTR